MAMWSEILGGLGAAGGGYAQALESVKKQNLDEKTQDDLMRYRDEESALRSAEEQARIDAQVKRDKIAADRYTADQLAQGERDAATEAERVLAEKFREGERQRAAAAAGETRTYRQSVVDAAEAERAAEREPEPHAIVAARTALERTANEDGAWLPPAAIDMLRAGHQDDGEFAEFEFALNWVLKEEMEKTMERPDFSPMELSMMPEDLRREFYLGTGQQQVDWAGDYVPPVPVPTDEVVPTEGSTGASARLVPGPNVAAMRGDSTGVGVPPTMPTDSLAVQPSGQIANAGLGDRPWPDKEWYGESPISGVLGAIRFEGLRPELSGRRNAGAGESVDLLGDSITMPMQSRPTVAGVPGGNLSGVLNVEADSVPSREDIEAEMARLRRERNRGPIA